MVESQFVPLALEIQAPRASEIGFSGGAAKALVIRVRDRMSKVETGTRIFPPGSELKRLVCGTVDRTNIGGR